VLAGVAPDGDFAGHQLAQFVFELGEGTGHVDLALLEECGCPFGPEDLGFHRVDLADGDAAVYGPQGVADEIAALVDLEYDAVRLPLPERGGYLVHDRVRRAPQRPVIDDVRVQLAVRAGAFAGHDDA
jgi:hypothetical protein